jgi:hypothetical protein
VDAWKALLGERKEEDDRLPCYHLMEKYSTDVLGILFDGVTDFFAEQFFDCCP